jgi:hypothetical protein
MCGNSLRARRQLRLVNGASSGGTEGSPSPPDIYHSLAAPGRNSELQIGGQKSGCVGNGFAVKDPHADFKISDSLLRSGRLRHGDVRSRSGY